tara:strand:+ start:2145 stop:2339 length:195 start_codon:yes stop_codon:yes gene_type:complete
MTVINLKTGKVKTKKPKKLPKCEICNTDVKDNGMSGKIGQLPISFCGICKVSIIQMLIDNSREE